MPGKFNDIAAVIATKDYPTARSWYSRVIGREPDLEPIEGVAECQIAAIAWLQLALDHDRAANTAVRIGVDDLAAQIEELAAEGIATGELVVIADLVKVLKVADPDGNGVSFVQDLTTEHA